MRASVLNISWREHLFVRVRYFALVKEGTRPSSYAHHHADETVADRAKKAEEEKENATCRTLGSYGIALAL